MQIMAQDRIRRIQSGEVLNKKIKKGIAKSFKVSYLPNLAIKGRSEREFKSLPEQSNDLVFTSPPNDNARKQYSEYEPYDDYLLTMRKVIGACRRVFIDRKFFVMNTSLNENQNTSYKTANMCMESQNGFCYNKYQRKKSGFGVRLWTI